MATDLEGRIVRLEIIIKAMQATNLKLDQRVQDLEQGVRTGSDGGGGGSGNSTAVFTIPPVVIAAGGNVTGQTVSVMVGGVSTTVTTTGKVYNQMAAATVATGGKTILVAPNGDGTYTAIAQSC